MTITESHVSLMSGSNEKIKSTEAGGVLCDGRDVCDGQRNCDGMHALSIQKHCHMEISKGRLLEVKENKFF